MQPFLRLLGTLRVTLLVGSSHSGSPFVPNPILIGSENRLSQLSTTCGTSSADRVPSRFYSASKHVGCATLKNSWGRPAAYVLTAQLSRCHRRCLSALYHSNVNTK